MQAELTEHLGCEPHDPAGDNSGNSRNGKSRKTLKGEFGELPIEVPRDRNSSFEPQIVPKGQTRFDGFDDKILSLYARGIRTREIQAHLEEIYRVEVSPALISTVTDAIIEEVKVWQNRPLDALYPVLYLDALQVKIRDGAHIRNKAIYLAIGINLQGTKEVLGIWVAQTEGARVLVADRDGVEEPRRPRHFHRVRGWTQGFPEAIETVFPEAQVQLRHRASGQTQLELWKAILREENLFVLALADGTAFVDNDPLAEETGRQVKRNGESLVEFH
jgi:putative transposase